MLVKIVTAIALFVAGSTVQAAALEGSDGDNNPVPRLAAAMPPAPDAYAAVHKRPIAQVQLRLPREAIGR